MRRTRHQCSQVLDRLDRAGIASLDKSQLDEIRQHAKRCARCRNAFRAAWVQFEAVSSESVESFEVPPFFAQRVMAHVRRNETEAVEEWLTWQRIWKVAPGLVSSLILFVVFLAGFAFFSESRLQAGLSGEEPSGIFSAEFILVEGGQEDQFGYEEALATLYESEGVNGSQ